MPRHGKIRVLFTSYDLVPSGDKKKLMRAFVDFCSRSLFLEQNYDVYVVDNREKHSIVTTAICFPEQGKLYVYGKGRSFPDMLRSIAHELTHMMQHEKGGLEYHELHFSSDQEDEANKFAGELLNAFSAVIGYEKIYEGKRENSKEALGLRRNLG
jgi:Zn-dependent peptidase ImmA (M78 family)